MISYAPRLRFTQRPQFFRGRDVQNVNARAGPFGQDRGAADRLDRNHCRSRRYMSEGINAAGIAHPQFAPHHDRVGLGVERNALASRCHHLEAFQHRTGRRRRNRAEGVAHVELEADHALGQLRHMLDGVLAEQPIEPKVDVRLLGRHFVLGGENVRRAGRRDCIWHVEHRGDAAECRRRGTAGEILFVRIARVAEMHMHVDRAGQQVHARDIECFARGRHGRVAADCDDRAVLDRNTRIDHAVGRDDLSVADDEIGADHAAPHNMAQPPSTGRSMPVIWRDASLARNRQALATSTSLVTRLRAYSEA